MFYHDKSWQGGLENMENTKLMDAGEVAEALGVSKSHAYKIIRELNREVRAKGCMTIAGKVSRPYFERRFFAIEREGATRDARL